MLSYIFLFFALTAVKINAEFPAQYDSPSREIYPHFDPFAEDDYHSQHFSGFCNESAINPIENYIKHKLQNWAEFSKSWMHSKNFSIENEIELSNFSSKGWLHDINLTSRTLKIKEAGNMSRKCIQLGLRHANIRAAFSLDNVTVGGSYAASGNILNFPIKNVGNWSLTLDLECEIFKRFNLTKEFKISNGMHSVESFCHLQNLFGRYEGLLDNIDMGSEGEKGAPVIKTMVSKTIDEDLRKLYYRDLWTLELKIKNMLLHLVDEALVGDKTLFEMATFKSVEK